MTVFIVAAYVLLVLLILQTTKHIRRIRRRSAVWEDDLRWRQIDREVRETERIGFRR